MMNRLHWTRLLAFVTGLVHQELLLRNEYLLAENRILRAHLPARLRLMDPERHTLAEIAQGVGRKLMKDIAQVAKPDTISGRYSDWSPPSSMARRSEGIRAARGLYGGGGVGGPLGAGQLESAVCSRWQNLRRQVT
jgi:hypothetical protein